MFDKYTHFRILNSWQLYAVAFVAYIVVLMCLISCKTSKQALTIHDTVTVKEGGKTEYVYQDTGTTITQYFPYFVRVKDTIIQPIDRIISKAGLTIHKTDTFYINQSMIKTVYQTSYKSNPYTPWWVYAIFAVAVLLTCYKIKSLL